jgi:hypothetical protein
MLTRDGRRAPVSGNDSFSAINDCFSLANYNDWPRCWELNSLSLLTVHLFRFMGGGDGRATKECTLDVLNTNKGLNLGILWTCTRYMTLQRDQQNKMIIFSWVITMMSQFDGIKVGVSLYLHCLLFHVYDCLRGKSLQAILDVVNIGRGQHTG